MGRRTANKREKRKKCDSSDGSINNDSVYKAGKFADSSKEEIDVSKISNDSDLIINNAEESSSDTELTTTRVLGPITSIDLPQPSDPKFSSTPTHSSTMSKPEQGQITNADIMAYLQKLDGKITSVESKMGKLDVLEQKVGAFESEFAKLWTYIKDSSGKTNERVGKVEDKVDCVDFSLGVINDKVINLEKERDSLRNEVVYLQSQSMRNNLIFANIPEAPVGVTEDCEQVLRTFMNKEMKIAQGLVDSLQFERVHRYGPRTDDGRKIVAKFSLFKEREMVRKQKKTLDDTDYYLHEQFPKEVAEKRRRHLPKLRKAIEAGKRAWLSYDTLYIDGKPVKDIPS